METAGVLSLIAQICPSTNGRQFSQAASEYSKLAGLLAGFAFTGLVFILREGVSGRFAKAVEMLVFAFFGLILTSANYAIITGEEEDYAAGRAVSEAVFASGAFTVSGILVLYSIILLLDAVERRAVESPAAVEEGEDDFGRVKRHLSAITATVVAFVLIVMVSPAGRQYADVTGETAVDVVRWAVLLAQLAVATIVGIAYLRHHRRHGRAPAADWTGTSRFGLLCLGFVLASTLAGLWAGSLAPCDQVPWPAAAAAIALHGAIMAYASVVIGRPWLRPRS